MATSLPPGTLKGRTLAVSVSQSPDLIRLRLSDEQLRRMLGEIVRGVLSAGGRIAYGGHLDLGGYTSMLTAEAARHSRGERPLLVCLAWPEHRRLPLSELQIRLDLGCAGRVVCLDSVGQETDPAAGRGEPPEAVDPDLARTSLSAMRRYMREHSDARLLIGGRRTGFQGERPGLVEEALLSLDPRHPQPLYLAAGFGGVTADIVRALRIDDCAWLPPDPDTGSHDPRLAAGLDELNSRAKAPGLHNGLTQEENRRLAVSQNPNTVAELVALGLRRLAR